MKSPLQKFTIPLNLLLIFSFISIGFVIGGYYYHQDLKVRIIHEKHEDLSAIAELKVNQINYWLKDHIGYANSIKENPLLTDDFKEFFDDPSSKLNRVKVLAWMKSRLNMLSLQNIYLLDSNGYFRLSLDPQQQSSPLHAKHQIEEAIASKSVVFSDFHKDENGKIHLGLIVPLLDNRVIYGLVVFEIDPDRSLYPLIQSWPTSSRTAETLLVRREGDEVVFLNELRHKKDAALNLKFSVNEKQVPAAMAVRGVQGIVEGTDYRSKKVLADLRYIPDTPWFLVTKIDSDEIFAPLKETALSVTLLVSLLIVAAAAFTGLLWRHQRAVFYRKQYEAAEKIARLTRLYAVLSQINQTIVRVRERDALFQKVCRIFVEFGKFRLAWIGLIDPETKLVNPVAMHGSGEEYLRNIRIAIDDSPTGRYPTGTAIKEGKYCVVNDIKNDPMMLPWREEALKRGYHSLAAAPIRLNREVIGAFAIYASEVDFFDKDEKKLIEEIGVDISFALESFETEAKQKQAEEALRAGEHFLASIFTSIQDGISILENDLTIIQVNSAIERWYAHALPLVGKKCYVAYHGRGEPCEVCPTRRTIETGQPGYEIVPKMGPEGKVVGWLDLYSFPLIDRTTGKMKGVIEYVRDCTDRKQAEEAMRDSEERYRSVINQSTDGIYMADIETRRIVAANPALCRILGYTHDEILGITLYDFVAHDREDIDQKFQKAIEGRNAGAERRYRRKDGTLIDVEVNINVITYGGKKVFTAVARDITELKRAEEERKKLEAQFFQAQKMEAIGTLAGGVAHDFNNLLTAIQGRTSLMLYTIDSGHPHFKNLKIIEDTVKRAADLTSQLLGFARGGKYEVKPTNLNELIEKSSELFGRTKKEITIHKNFQYGLWRVELDRGQIEQVLLNLFVNAADAMPKEGDVYLRTGNVTIDEKYIKPFQITPGPYVKITVTDTGVGMDKETQRRIFEPFFTTKELGRGTGLGLASAYGIVKNHGGFINVYSEVGKGTTFTIYLPASEKEVVGGEEKTTEILRGKEAVLLVDDEAMIREVGKELLEFLGYTVLVAKSGGEAVEVYRENKDKIDLVILDMIMPEMEGGEVYIKLKEINPDIKVLLSSGYSINGQAKKIMERGCDGFIPKPFEVKELSQKIREVLEKK